MGNLEYLFWALAEFVDLALYAHLFYWVSDLLDVYHAFICHVVEH